jgi:hypothetical protein
VDYLHVILNVSEESPLLTLKTEILQSPLGLLQNDKTLLNYFAAIFFLVSSSFSSDGENERGSVST